VQWLFATRHLIEPSPSQIETESRHQADASAIYQRTLHVLINNFRVLLTAKNAFQANSKSITTASEDMQTVIGLIR
jgi:hypothetical protein